MQHRGCCSEDNIRMWTNNDDVGGDDATGVVRSDDGVSSGNPGNNSGNLEDQQQQKRNKEWASVAHARDSFRRRSINSARDVSLLWNSKIAKEEREKEERHRQWVERSSSSHPLCISLPSPTTTSFEAREEEKPEERYERKESTTATPVQVQVQKDTKKVEKTTLSWARFLIPNKHVQTLITLAWFSYAGEFLRWFTEELFGSACHHPGTVGWNLDGAPPCTTAPGTTDALGGAMFADMPPNIIGCFIMGLLVTGHPDVVAIHLPMAMLPRHHPFQAWTMTHLGMRTGFCGALTTFASWNTQMVVMLCAGKGTSVTYSQWVSALWGYLVGWFVAVRSYETGRDVANAVGRRVNPGLALEADLTRDKSEAGYLVHHDIRDDFVRRFLHDIAVMAVEEEERECQREGEEQMKAEENPLSDDVDCYEQNKLQLQKYGPGIHSTSLYLQNIHHLRKWKASTDADRRVGAEFARELMELEKALLAAIPTSDEERREIELEAADIQVSVRPELTEIARDAGWDVQALQEYVQGMRRTAVPRTSFEGTAAAAAAKHRKHHHHYHHRSAACVMAEIVTNGVLLLLCTGLLIWGVVTYRGNDPVSTHYLAQFLSSLLAPFGTFTRWYLSRLNGKGVGGCSRRGGPRWEWLPVGTLLANLSASVVSALMQALLLVPNGDNILAIAFMNAIKAGYAGSLSTVSTFAAETVGLFAALPRHYWGYYYSFGSMILAMILGVVVYVWATV